MGNTILHNRAILFFGAAIVTLISGYYLIYISKENRDKPVKRKRLEYVVFIIVSIGLLCFSGFYEYFAINPSYKTEDLKLVGWVTDSKTLASECFFVDVDDREYELMVPFDTVKKDMGSKDLQKESFYIVKYEEHSKVVVDIMPIQSTTIKQTTDVAVADD